MTEFVPQRTSAYISQNDNHIGELTVRETLDFAAQVQGVCFKYSHMIEELARTEMEEGICPDPAIDAFMKACVARRNPGCLQTDYILKVLGLEECADTVIGNEMLRRISGGHVVYLGPCERIMEFFETLGFNLPPRALTLPSSCSMFSGMFATTFMRSLSSVETLPRAIQRVCKTRVPMAEFLPSFTLNRN